MNTQKYCGKIEVYSLVLTDPMNINSLTVQNSKYFTSILSNFNFYIPIYMFETKLQIYEIKEKLTKKNMYINVKH